MPEVLVLAAKTWGALGNFLAASHVGQLLRRGLRCSVEVHPAEEWIPWVADVGGRIATLTREAASASDLRRNYLALVADLCRILPAGFEQDGSAVTVDFGALRDHLQQSQPPEVIVATKGVVSRLAQAAVRAAGVDTRVLTYVTNPGLCRLPVHATPGADGIVVPFEWTRSQVVQEWGVGPERVVTAGPLLASTTVMGSTDAAPDAIAAGHEWAVDRPVVLVFSNRGGAAYLHLVTELARSHPGIGLVFVAHGDPELAAEARRRCGVEHWRFYDRLGQRQYFDYLWAAASVPGSFLVTKAGPNTTLEAASCGVPVLALPSGLPMEDWVPSLLRRQDLGMVVQNAAALISQTRHWLAEPEAVRRHRAAALAFARESLDQARAEKVVLGAVCALQKEAR